MTIEYGKGNPRKDREDELYWMGYEAGKELVQFGHAVKHHMPKDLTLCERAWWDDGVAGGQSDARSHAARYK